ncbi:enolase [Alphaproteobacteria bacterium]|nr:enolase [Alphaproteobacteria bacterium]GHS96443.1 enolase [Alphaproteobacteria bacterium]
MVLAIQKIRTREILDSRGIPTVEADVVLNDGIFGRAAVPSGASTGSYEAVERRDGGERFGGKGVQSVLHAIQTVIEPQLVGWDAEDQRALDTLLRHLDGTANKANLGANALLAVSLAMARASANAKQLPLYRYLRYKLSFPNLPMCLPMPLVNVINGGVHADNDLAIQEFMIVPVGAHRFTEAIGMCSEVFQALKNSLKKQGHNTNVGDEGGLAPQFHTTKEVFEALLVGVQQAGYQPGKDICFALDCAANELFDGKNYKIDGITMSSHDLISYYEDLTQNYPIVSIEDGLQEDDWEGWHELTQRLGSRLQLVGDDLYVTHLPRLKKGFEEEASNAILIKPNQVGTLTETLDVTQIAQSHPWNAIISHRSGETEDTFIADLAVAVGAGQIKAGSTSRSERLAKYNQLIRIEEELGDKAVFSSFGEGIRS